MRACVRACACVRAHDDHNWAFIMRPCVRAYVHACVRACVLALAAVDTFSGDQNISNSLSGASEVPDCEHVSIPMMMVDTRFPSPLVLDVNDCPEDESRMKWEVVG